MSTQRSAALVVFVSFFAVALAACGGADEDPATGAYADQVALALQAYGEARDSLSSEIPAPGEDSDVTDARQFFERTVSIQSDLLSAFAAIADPPSGVHEAHSDLVTTTQEFLVLNERILEQLANAGPDFAMASLATDPVLGTANQNLVGEAAVTACKEIQRAMKRNGADRKLPCDIG